MKKTGLILLVILMMVVVAGMAGCSSAKLEVADMAGSYALAKITLTPNGGSPILLSPPEISGTLTLTGAGTFSATITIFSGSETTAGTFTVDDPKIVFTDESGSTNGVIANDGKTILVTAAGGSGKEVQEFVRF